MDHDAPPTDEEMAREPFGPSTIDPRVVGRELDPTTGEVRPRRAGPPGDHRRLGPGDDVRNAAWPPPTQGPLPEQIPPDFHVGTALDELDVWAVEYQRAENELRDARVEAKRTKREYELAKAKARRIARASPTEKGRRTAEDITSEVVEETHQPGGPYDRMVDAETRVENATTAYFAAAKEMDRCDTHVRAARRADYGGPGGGR